MSNSQIVEQLKRHFNSQGTATADDILNGVINDAKDKRQAIETILQTRINKDKAKIIADVIARVQRTNQISWISFTLRLKARQMIY